jgi:GNAT superfamily N-acetyltransferase
VVWDAPIGVTASFWRATVDEVRFVPSANTRGGDSHVANCGFIVAADASGRGVARAMCAHSLERARERGFTAMQFNFVISSNERAIQLWQNCGFVIVGTLPETFAHPTVGLCDVSGTLTRSGYFQVFGIVRVLLNAEQTFAPAR